jgi:hypothetical protein
VTGTFVCPIRTPASDVRPVIGGVAKGPKPSPNPSKEPPASSLVRRQQNMVHVRTFTLPHYEDYPVQVALFRNVSNATFLRSQLLQANADFDYAFLDATMVRRL